MTAPDRILAYNDPVVDATYWVEPTDVYLTDHHVGEYVRADLVAALIRDAVEAEREACAKFVEGLHTQSASTIAAAIRARKGGA